MRPEPGPEQLAIPFVGPVPSAGIGSLGSGSRGNGTLVSMAGTLLLIDCGFTLKDTETRLARLGVSGSDVTAVLVTHEHSDHVQGVALLARRYRLPVYASHGTVSGHRDWRDVDVKPYRAGRRFAIGDVEVLPVPVPHDAREPTQFVVEGEAGRVGVLTDLGEIPDAVRRCYEGCDALLVEANHDRDLRWNGRYPYPLKRRVAGPVGHLANVQTLEFLESVSLSPEAAVLIGHVSQENNEAALLERLFAPLRTRLPRLDFATQSGASSWQALD